MALTDSLVSYWKLDETSGNRADSYGSNTLIDNNTTPSSTGKIGNAADSNGSDDYLRADDHSSLDITGDITINFWVNSGSGTKTHFGKWDTSSNNSYLLQIFSDDLIYWAFSGTGSNTLYRVANSTISRSGWHMVSGTYVASTQTAVIYYDGQVVAGTNVGTLPTTIFSGTSGFSNRYLAGSLQYSQGLQDEVGLWSRALSGSEIEQLYNSGNGLAYPFTSNTHDASGGFLFAGLARVTGQLSFASIGQLLFNGLGSVRTSALVLGSGQLLFSGVATAAGISAVDGLITIGDGTTDQAIVLASSMDTGPILNGFGYYSYHGAGGNAHGSVGSMPNTGQYYHLTLTRDNNEIKFYVNGNLIDTINLSGQTAAYGSTPVVNIGRRVADYFNGRIDDVRVYSRALPQIAVTSLSQGDDLSNASFSIGVIGGSTGPLRFSGQATTTFTPNYNMTGNLFITGDADESMFSGFFHEAAGYLLISGLASTSLNFYHQPTGMLRFTGLAVLANSHTYLASGQLLFTGQGVFAVRHVYLVSGLLQLSGIATTEQTNVFDPSGALLFTGQGVFSASYVYRAFGKLLISGLATYQTFFFVNATGTLFFTGIANVTVSYIYLASGMLRFNGLASTSNASVVSGLGALLLTGQGVFGARYANYQPTGKLIFTGEAHAFSGEEVEPVGGLVLSGQGRFAATYRYLASGLLRFSGDMGVSAVTYEASGLLLLSGTVPLQKVYVFQPTGKLLLYEPTLLAWWRFNEGTGTLAGDSSGYHKTGTLFNMENGDWVGGTPFLPSNPYSLSFDGIEEYVGADFSHGEGITEFTISLWANTTALPPAPGGMGMTMSDFLLDALDAELFLLENEEEFTITFAVPKPQVNH